MSRILRRAFWPTASDTSNGPSDNENMTQITTNTVSFTEWGNDHPTPMDKDPVMLSHKLDQGSWTPLTNPSGGSWINDQGIASESNQVQVSNDVDKVPMEDEIDQSRVSAAGEMGDSEVLTAGGKNARELAREEVNEGMPGFLSVGEPPELSRAHSIEGGPSMSYSWQEDPLFMTPKRTRHHAPETQLTPKLRFQEVDRSLDLRTQLRSQTSRSRQRQENLQAEVRKLTSQLDENDTNHHQELQKQMQLFSSKFDEQARAHAAERAADIERFQKELQAQKDELANLKKCKESELATLMQQAKRQQSQDKASKATRSVSPSETTTTHTPASRVNSRVRDQSRTTPTRILLMNKAAKKNRVGRTGKTVLLSHKNQTNDQSTDEDEGHPISRRLPTKTKYAVDWRDESDEDKPDMSVVEENAGSEDESLLGGEGFATLSGLAQRLVPILVPALVPALTDGIRDALPDMHRPHQKTPKNKSRGVKELRDARRQEKEDEDSEERRTILNYLRDFFKDLLGYDEDDDFIQHKPVAADTIEAFLEGDGPGPNLSDLHFDLPAGLKSHWNIEALRLVREKFCQDLLNNLGAGELPRSEEYFNTIVQERFTRLAGIWRIAQPEKQRNGKTETYEDVEQRLNGRRDGMLQSYRHFTRRATKFEGRKRIVESVIELKIEEGDAAGDLETWEWLLEMLKWYGQDGMSSDETDYEGLEVVYRVRILPWRQDVTGYLDIIDRERKLPDQIVYSRAGSKPTKRIRGDHHPKSTRKAPKGLPSILYDREWLEGLSQHKRSALAVSKEQFEWLKIKLRKRVVPYDKKGKGRAI